MLKWWGYTDIVHVRVLMNPFQGNYNTIAFKLFWQQCSINLRIYYKVSKARLIISVSWLPRYEFEVYSDQIMLDAKVTRSGHTMTWWILFFKFFTIILSTYYHDNHSMAAGFHLEILVRGGNGCGTFTSGAPQTIGFRRSHIVHSVTVIWH